MEKIINNPGLQHLAENVFLNLNYADLKKCQLINQAASPGAPIGAKKWWCTTGRGISGYFHPKKPTYIYTFGAGQKKWWCTCTTGTT